MNHIRYFFINSPPMIFCRICALSKIYSPIYKRTRESCSSLSYNHFSTHEYPSNLDEDIENKIIYNSYLHRLGFVEKKRLQKFERRLKGVNLFEKVLPVSLKYLPDYEQTAQEPVKEDVDEPSYVVNLPYTLKTARDNILDPGNEIHTEDNSLQAEKNEIGERISDIPAYAVGKWMNDYEKYSEEQENDTDIEIWRNDYGIPDPSVPVSQVPCGGCGALLHCQDHSIPGYLPSEIFKNCSKNDLREAVCQRCHFLKNYNTALAVRVDPDVYPKLISKIKVEKALVILIADMTDLPCSIWPGILDIIGPKRPIFLVGNKVDLLWGDRRRWLEHALSCLRSCFPASSVKHTSLISAKTGFGVEELITKLHNIWQYKGDVYLVGCANVGKSTLFNALLQSDYCKAKAVDLIQRATTAPWPGTTINLLKFPILRPEGWRLYLRTMRLKAEQKKRAAESKLRKQQRTLLSEKSLSPQLVGHIGRTFVVKEPKEEVETLDNFTLASKTTRLGLNPNDPDFSDSKWLYDTPGVLHKDQILEFLTTEEVSLTMSKEIIEPRTFSVKKGWALFIAGLARIDYLMGNKNIKLTVFSSKSLPITITELSNADKIYKNLLGTDYMVVPHGPKERLDLWPGLESALEVSLVGIHAEESCADVTLSSAGWVSVTPEKDEIVKMQFWTPNRRGVHVRTPPLLPKAVALRGQKKKKSPTYQKSSGFSY